MNDICILHFNVLVSPTDLWPTPPNDDQILSEVSHYLDLKKSQSPAQRKTLSWDYGCDIINRCVVFVITRDDLDEDTEETASYKLVVQLAVFLEEGFSIESADMTAKTLLSAWHQAVVNQALPPANAAEWRVGKNSIGFIDVNDD